MQLWLVWFSAAAQLRPGCRRTRTFLWLMLALAAFSLRSDSAGVTSLVRALDLRGAAYPRLLHLFHRSKDMSATTSPSRPFGIGTRTEIRLDEQHLVSLAVRAGELLRSEDGLVWATVDGEARDILLDRRPFFWVQHANWLWALLALCIGAMLFMRARHVEPTARAMQWPDALGLGLFAAGGTQVALGMAMPEIVAVLMGMVTAVFGGVLRDIVCNEIPSAFSDHRPYAVCAFLGGWVLVGARAAGVPDEAAVLLAAAVATGTRALALATDYRLPAWVAGAGHDR